MKNIFLLAIGLILLSSCQKDGDLEVNLSATFKDVPLELNTTYEFGDIRLKFENLGFFLTDIALVNADNEEVALAEVEFIELSDPSTGQTLSYTNLPGGTYNKLKFNIGVTEDLNAKTPNDYNVGEPLGRSDYYWEAWDSYIFSKTEGSADVIGDDIFDLKWFYHTGSDALNRAFELDQEIVIGGDAEKIELFLDYDQLLRNDDGSPFDIENNPRNHNPAEIGLITQLVDNYAKALKVKI